MKTPLPIGVGPPPSAACTRRTALQGGARGALHVVLAGAGWAAAGRAAAAMVAPIDDASPRRGPRDPAMAAAGERASPATVGGTAGLAPGDPVPWPRVELIDGSEWGPERAAGRAVVLVIWSTYCVFCVRHNPRLERLHRAARAGGRALEVLGVAIDGDPELVRRHAAAHGLTFPITLDDERLRPLFTRRRMTPMTVTVDRRGQLLQVIPGEMSEDDVMELLPRLAP